MGRSSEEAPRRADAQVPSERTQWPQVTRPRHTSPAPSDTSSQSGRPTLAFIRVRLRLVPEPTASAESRAVAAAAGPLGSPLGRAAAAVACASSRRARGPSPGQRCPLPRRTPAGAPPPLRRGSRHTRSLRTRAGWGRQLCPGWGRMHAPAHVRAHTHTPPWALALPGRQLSRNNKGWWGERNWQ